MLCLWRAAKILQVWFKWRGKSSVLCLIPAHILPSMYPCFSIKRSLRSAKMFRGIFHHEGILLVQVMHLNLPLLTSVRNKIRSVNRWWRFIPRCFYLDLLRASLYSRFNNFYCYYRSTANQYSGGNRWLRKRLQTGLCYVGTRIKLSANHCIILTLLSALEPCS